jgi:hypothetical protein
MLPLTVGGCTLKDTDSMPVNIFIMGHAIEKDIDW